LDADRHKGSGADPCFPAKTGISHVYNPIHEKHRKKPLNAKRFASQIPLGRLGAAEDIAKPALFPASGYSSYVKVQSS